MFSQLKKEHEEVRTPRCIEITAYMFPQLKHYVAELKTRLQSEHRKRKQAEGQVTDVNSRFDEMVRLETEKYVGEYEKACDKYYTDLNSKDSLEAQELIVRRQSLLFVVSHAYISRPVLELA